MKLPKKMVCRVGQDRTQWNSVCGEKQQCTVYILTLYVCSWSCIRRVSTCMVLASLKYFRCLPRRSLGSVSEPC
jgi:hypothetical protein